MYMYYANYNRFQMNRSEDNTSDGVRAYYSDMNRFENEQYTRNGGSGLYFNQSHRNVLDSVSFCTNVIDGINIYYSDTLTVVNSILNQNGQRGLYLYNAQENLFENNVFSMNTLYGAMSQWNSHSNVFRNNRFDNNRINGVYMNSAATNVFVQNTVDSNADYGVRVDNARAGNVFVKNNIYPSPYQPTRGISYQSQGIFCDFSRNFWHSTDSQTVSSKIVGTDIQLIPFRLGGVDISIGADTYAPTAPARVWLGETSSLTRSCTIVWATSTSGEESDAPCHDLGGYRVYRSTLTSPDDWGLPIANVSPGDTDYYDSGLNFRVTYFYRVTAYDTSTPYENESWFSDSIASCMLLGVNIIGGDVDIDTVYISIFASTDYSGISIQLVQANDTSSVVAADTTTVAGTYALLAIEDGNYQLWVKHPRSLRRVVNVTVLNGVVVGGLTIPDLVMGDANGDDKINAFDLGILGGTFNNTTDLRADFNNDGTVNAFDLGVLGGNFNKVGDNS